MADKFSFSPDEQKLLDSLVRGEISFYKVEKQTDIQTAIKIRRSALEEMTATDLNSLGQFTIDSEDASKRNVENMIGAIQIPVGVAGPIKVNGEYAEGSFYLPLATTEGALVASVNRGCSAITASGGSTVRIFKDQMTRAPVYCMDGVRRSREFVDWINLPEVFMRLKEKASETTRFGELTAVEPYVTGNNVYLRFCFDTKDAMGMNMVTIATQAIVDLIGDEFGVYPISLSGNMCTDKKPAAINSILGRGKTVVAEVELSPEIVQNKLKTTPEAMAEVNYRKNLLGSARAISLGFNAHAANTIAAMFLACGQDPAHVVEGSNTITTMEVTKYGSLYCSVTLPSLQLGTVGGGTKIATQNECLRILDVAGAGESPGYNSKKLAEIIASAVLAGEISLVGAQAAGHLARAHAELGR
ncbi:hydroxymethylglutaryl-CoA reductase (NADPH) [Methanohalophilus levihalophilus]|uniref:hydroxymethylglutaryl-CoA reductase (NADPH) n=1 Tax=Methanohalophilus levihalophilus TaxID=1431282 RepID=UPI001AE8BB16|nr:hydroxymethylglutaryl-CoA reductase (NADPH) [Methanohalophilus levihalophilus]MBP2030514.1 hydroxymethylglutaryl-CoA reductase (NADPH) [Methanohalophilus levihalophilus]